MRWIKHSLCVLFLTSSVASAEVLDIAHRGYAMTNPESTMQAFRSAQEQGADGIEFDVRQTADGVLVVTHDAAISSLGGRLVENVEFSDIYLETNIPTLEEVLLFAKQVNQTAWLEIKQSHRYKGIIQNVLNVVTKYDLENQTVIQSFNHQDLRTIKQLKPKLRLLALFSVGFSERQMPSFVDYVGLPIINSYLDADLIRRIHAKSKQVIFWRKNTSSENQAVLKQFIGMGADGFMLDQSLKAILSGNK